MVKGLDLFRERFRPFEGTMTWLSNSFSVKSRVGEVMLVGKGYDYLRWIGLR